MTFFRVSLEILGRKNCWTNNRVAVMGGGRRMGARKMGVLYLESRPRLAWQSHAINYKIN